jgi:hypothetical protein
MIDMIKTIDHYALSTALDDIAKFNSDMQHKKMIGVDIIKNYQEAIALLATDSGVKSALSSVQVPHDKLLLFVLDERFIKTSQLKVFFKEKVS